MTYNTAWAERATSRSAQIGLVDPTAELTFIGKNNFSPSDDADAHASLLAIIPLLYPGVTYAVLTFLSYEIKPLGGGAYDAVVKYGRSDPQYSFDTAGGHQKITQSIYTWGSGHNFTIPTAPDYKGAIGVSDTGVEGVEIDTAAFHWQETYHIHPSIITSAYRKQVAKLTDTVNVAAFRDFDVGEVRFLGASGTQRGLQDFEITFKFAQSDNQFNIKVGDFTVLTKNGWQYLWIRYQDTKDIGTNTIVKVPLAAYVEQVYEDGDFDLLGIGS